MLISRPSLKALVIDDQPDLARAVASLLESKGFRARAVFDPLEAIQLTRSEDYHLVLMDINMPEMSGLTLLARLKEADASATYVMMTAQGTVTTIIQALKSGAQGFVVKPFTLAELWESVELALEKTRLIRENVRMRVYTPLLYGATAALLGALEARDGDTQSHSRRVSYYAEEISKDFGLSQEDIINVRMGSLFHDIGKIGIPDHILLKPGPLDPEERAEMQKHPEIGWRIIRAVQNMDKVADIVKAHHERYDGRGYPDKLAGEAIPLGARITTVADCFEAIVTPRVYSPGRSQADALAELHRCRGTQFDPDVVDVFIRKMETKQILYRPATEPYQGNFCITPMPAAYG